MSISIENENYQFSIKINRAIHTEIRKKLSFRVKYFENFLKTSSRGSENEPFYLLYRMAHFSLPHAVVNKRILRYIREFVNVGF